MATLRAARLRSKVVTQGKHHHKNGCGGNQDFGDQAVLHLGKLPRSIAPWFNYDKRFNKTTLSNIRCSSNLKNSVTYGESAHYRGSGNHRREYWDVRGRALVESRYVGRTC